jgi:putative peptidoglycan lipid II flippase
MTKYKKDSVVKSTALISAVVLLGKVLGFIKQSIIAWAFGANANTDVYFAADGYTSMFGQIMGQSVSPTVLTRYIKLDEEKQHDKSNKIIKESFFFFGLIGLIITFVNILLSYRVCNLIGISYSLEQKKNLHFFLIATCPIVIFTSVAGVAQAYLDAHKKFIPAKLCSLFFSVSIILFVLIFRKIIGIKSLLLGFIIGYLIHTIYMISIVLPKTGLYFGNPFRDFEFRQMIKRFVPLVIGNSVVDLGHLIDRIVASSLEEGSVSTLYYGQVVSSDIVYAVIVSSIGTVLLTTLTKTVSTSANVSNIKKHIQLIVCAMTLISSLISSLYLVEGIDLIKMFFERGNFDSNNTTIVFSVASCYALGFVFLSNREVLIKAHYAFQDSLSPMINSIIGVIVNLLGSIILSKIMGVAGIAIATSFSMLVVSILSLFTLKKHIGAFPIEKSTLYDLAKIIVGAFASIILGKIIFRFLFNMNYLIRMILISIIVVLIFVTIMFILREKVTKQYVIPKIEQLLVKIG